ncbi:hypothetical protein AB3X94_09060 [Paraburkholderia sp. BR10923]|uniref:hypothetical protein n=1 Tax=Paraburkholderia sp. BR10923 TaxID=3236992 RepID=UPI0034CD7CA9
MDNIAEMKIPRFGIYYYPWYSAARWRQHPRRHTPRIGEYHSGDEKLVAHHAKQLQALGVDFIVIEALLETDWNFEETFAATLQLCRTLKAHQIEFTFLVDTFGGVYREELIDQFSSLVDMLREKSLISDNHKLPLYFFSPQLPLATDLTDRFDDSFECYFPIFIPDWNYPNAQRLEALARLGYIPFWTQTDRMFALHGHASVVPGYDDLLLARDPQLAPVVPREDGLTLVEQFRRAVETGADNVLIYGWNEYFETTTIEPTLEYGDFYLELTRELIAQVRQGLPIQLPADIGQPRPAAPVYLSPELELAARRHPDGVPRWDQDDHVADLDAPSAAAVEQGHAFYRDVLVTNTGMKPWRIATMTHAIRLGIRLRAPTGEVVREGRAELGTHDILPKHSVRTDLGIEVTGLQQGTYQAEIDVVWEGKFWFGSTQCRTLTI